MTIYERAIELIPDNSVIGLGSGRAAWAFVKLLGDRVRTGKLKVHGVACSEETAQVADDNFVPLLSADDAEDLAKAKGNKRALSLTIDGADEVDPQLNLIKGYGRALVREKVVAALSEGLIILVGEEKLVPQLGSRGKLPVEVIPFAVPLCMRRLKDLGLEPVLWDVEGRPGLTDNGNRILDCRTGPVNNPAALDSEICAIPGVVGTGLFINMADVVLIGANETFELLEEQHRRQ